ncbi:anti sigma factor C-terminal domain-containing protein [Cytobacillus massiliigabonensis]|uniref:anti sigma factor C-terminal domain-containing protein n=1 Tax=Cytobacillus massiliigabonensis TaxID=1871011 RepID=UPI000C867A3B|nr:anti sigma factor C-terminal domain-containing protein [Cytobacillus massiliigabonensis]
MNDFTDDFFDERKIKKAIKKGKMKTIFTIGFISLIVFIILNILNFAISAYYSQKTFKQWDAFIRLSTPNGYISETVDSRGFLGGISNYKVAKDMKIKSVVIEQKQYPFGLIPSVLISRGSGGSIGITGEDWQVSYKENGWREMMFFHPMVKYKKYKSDEDVIQRMQGDKIYEVALSFDKPYKPNELPISELPEMTWFWINTYTNSEIKTFQKEANEHDWSSTFIREHDALGFSINSSYTSTADLDFDYDGFLELLKTSVSSEHKKVYSTFKDIKIEDIEILGVVVYGTKDQILEMIKVPSIKAASLGGIADNY